MKIECPSCGTMYTPERLGIKLPGMGMSVMLTVLCPVCKKAFDATIEEKVLELVPQIQGWVDWALRRDIKVIEKRGLVVTSTKRDRVE